MPQVGDGDGAEVDGAGSGAVVGVVVAAIALAPALLAELIRSLRPGTTWIA